MKVYLVDASVNTATVPSNPALILGQSQVQIVASNAQNVIVVPSNGLTSNQQYRVLYDFSVAQNCNQQNTKYVLDAFVIQGANAPLPVTYKRFDAQLRNGKAALIWETATEFNNRGFEVERRINGEGFKSIGFVFSQTADGNSNTPLSYSFEDATLPANSTAYYRLRQIDLDGKVNISDIRAVRNNTKVAVSLYPNPSRGTVNIAIPSGSGIFDVTLDDMTGKSVQRWTNQSTPNMQISNIKPGMYMLRINFRETGEQVIERVLVQ